MKIYSIGDIHGCYNELRDLLDLIEKDRNDEQAKVVFLGDYIDRGPDSALVVDHLDSLRKKGKEGYEFVFLKGNHEDMLIRGVLDAESRDQADMFWYNGGHQTKQSYDEWNFRFADHYDFYKSLERYHRHGEFFFVHACLPPTETMEEALREPTWAEDDLLWCRVYNDWHREFPENVYVIHGHTPVPSVTFYNNQVNIDTGCVFGKEWSDDYGQLTAVRLDGRSDDQIEILQVRRKFNAN